MNQILDTVVAAFALFVDAPGAPQSPSPVAWNSNPRSGQPVAGTGTVSSRHSESPADITANLLGLAQEWVGTWNEKNVDRMQQLHDDDFLYGYGIIGRFIDGQGLLKEIRKEDFWGVNYTLKMVEPRVQIISSDTALVLFQLVGKTVGPKGTRPYSSLFTLVYQKRGSDWKIIHVHDSERAGSNS